MKNLFFLIGAIAVISLSGCKQTNTDVPSKVKAEFNQKFPDATKVQWDMESESEWEAEFILNGVEYSANFISAGQWMETEHEIGAVDIPEAVKATLDKAYGDYKLEVSEVSESTEGKVYEFELKKGKEEFSVAIDASGKVLDNEEMEAEDED